MSERKTIALAGNPNSGKTTLFNALTGSRQHVGNYPGITVEKKQGVAVSGSEEFTIVDLPGTYSLTAYSQEEIVARDYLALERPDAVIDIVNAGALERNLYLAVQIMELGAPLVLGLNMMDEAKKQNLVIHSEKLSKLLEVPVVETVARTGKGTARLLAEAAEVARGKKGRGPEPLVLSYGQDVDEALMEMSRLVEETGFLTNRYPARWTALKYLEGDEEVMALGREHGETASRLEDIAERTTAHCQATLDTYPEAIIADYRYGYIASILKQGVLTRDVIHKRMDLSDRMDKVLTHRLFGPLLMLAVLFVVYQITFTIGDYPLGWMEGFFGWLGETISSALPNGMLKSLLVSGIIDGVGGVLGFVPLIMLIFLQIAFLEDSGYMARIAYMLDRVFRIFGLHGCSVMPFIISGGIGGGCAVPGIMATRTLRSRREKLATLLTAPFMTCGAKLPVFILLVGVFFPSSQALVLFLITLAAWAFALLVARLLRSTVIKGPSTPFVMELPPYRLPTLRGIMIHTWERTWQYIKKAGTIILAISVLIWAAMTFPGPDASAVTAYNLQRAEIEAAMESAGKTGDAASLEKKLAVLDADHAMRALSGSAAGRLGNLLEPVSQLAGFDWRTNIALIGGFAAKEVIVSTLGTAYSLGEADQEEAVNLHERLASDPSWTKAKGVALILFIMLYAPCFVAVAAIKQESGSWGWAIFSTVFNTSLAFVLAMGAYQLGRLI